VKVKFNGAVVEVGAIVGRIVVVADLGVGVIIVRILHRTVVAVVEVAIRGVIIPRINFLYR